MKIYFHSFAVKIITFRGKVSYSKNVESEILLIFPPFRISSLVEKLCTYYGPKICDLNGVDYHAFPHFDEMMDEKVEQQLRSASFGYRAKFIQRSAAEIHEKGGLEWFNSVQNMTYKDAHGELTKLTGIGPKVIKQL